MESLFRTIDEKMVGVQQKLFSRTCGSCVGLIWLFLLLSLPCSAKILYSNLQTSGEVFDFSGFPGVFFTPAFYPPSQNAFFEKEVTRLIGERGKLTYVHLDKSPSVYDGFELNASFGPRLITDTPHLFIIAFTLRSPVISVINKAYTHADLWESVFVIERDDSFDADIRAAITQSLEAFLPIFLEQNKDNKSLLFYMPDLVTHLTQPQRSCKEITAISG